MPLEITRNTLGCLDCLLLLKKKNVLLVYLYFVTFQEEELDKLRRRTLRLWIKYNVPRKCSDLKCHSCPVYVGVFSRSSYPFSLEQCLYCGLWVWYSSFSLRFCNSTSPTAAHLHEPALFLIIWFFFCIRLEKRSSLSSIASQLYWN